MILGYLQEIIRCDIINPNYLFEDWRHYIMSCIIKSLDKRSGITYVYSSESYWDKEKKAPRNKRTLIGKVDPLTGETIPTTGTRRKANERKKIETEKRLVEGINALEQERSDLSQKYIEVLDQFELHLQEIEKDIHNKQKDITETRRLILNKQ